MKESDLLYPEYEVFTASQLDDPKTEETEESDPPPGGDKPGSGGSGGSGNTTP